MSHHYKNAIILHNSDSDVMEKLELFFFQVDRFQLKFNVERLQINIELQRIMQQNGGFIYSSRMYIYLFNFLLKNIFQKIIESEI